jgi:hypothetical protein
MTMTNRIYYVARWDFEGYLGRIIPRGSLLYSDIFENLINTDIIIIKDYITNKNAVIIPAYSQWLLHNLTQIPADTINTDLFKLINDNN